MVDRTTHPAILTPPFVRVAVATFWIEVAWSLTIHLPRFFQDLGASEGQIGLLYSVAAAVGLALRPLVGRLLDVWGRKPLLVTAAVTEVVFLAAYLLVSAFAAPAFVIRVIQASAQLIMFTALMTYAADALPAARRAQGLALFGLTGLIPIGVGGVLGDVVIDAGGFTALLTSAVVAAALGATIMITLPVLPTLSPGDEARRSIWAAAKQPDLLPMWVLGLTFSIGLESIFVFMATFVDESRVGSAGVYFVAHSASAVAVRLVGSGWTDRFGYRRVVLPSITMFAAAFVGLAFVDAVPLLVVAGVLAGTGHGTLFPAISSQVVARARPSERGSAIAVFTALFDLALLAGIPVVGRIIDTVGYRAAFLTIAVMISIGIAGFVVLDENPHRSPGAMLEASGVTPRAGP
ncbi:MAG: MFS transporter [Acidimicrobiia bacterium]|nr:MFS transporter [Acidimicrobiia bacterium]